MAPEYTNVYFKWCMLVRTSVSIHSECLNFASQWTLQTTLLFIVGEFAGWGSAAVAVNVSDKWQETNDKWHATCDMLYVTHDMGQMTYDPWHMAHDT